MKIRFVTESHWSGDEKRTVDVACQKDLEKTNGRVDAHGEFIEKINKRLTAIEKRVAGLEGSLAGEDKRLRDDCRSIFHDVIDEALAPVLAAMESVAKGCGMETVRFSDKRSAVSETMRARKTPARDLKSCAVGKRAKAKKVVK